MTANFVPDGGRYFVVRDLCTCIREVNPDTPMYHDVIPVIGWHQPYPGGMSKNDLVAMPVVLWKGGGRIWNTAEDEGGSRWERLVDAAHVDTPRELSIVMHRAYHEEKQS